MDVEQLIEKREGDDIKTSSNSFQFQEIDEKRAIKLEKQRSQQQQ